MGDEERTMSMSQDWIQTLRYRHEIIEEFLVPSPAWGMSPQEAHLGLALTRAMRGKVSNKDASEDLLHAQMLLELRLLTLYESVVGPKEVEADGRWNGRDGEWNQLLLTKATFIN